MFISLEKWKKEKHLEEYEDWMKEYKDMKEKGIGKEKYALGIKRIKDIENERLKEWMKYGIKDYRMRTYKMNEIWKEGLNKERLRE